MAFWILQPLTFDIGPLRNEWLCHGLQGLDDFDLYIPPGVRPLGQFLVNFWYNNCTTTTMVLTLTLTLLLEFQEIRRTFTLASFKFSNGCHIQGGVPNYPCGKVRCRLYMAPI